MTNKGGIQTPFDEAVAPVSDGSPAGSDQTGGFDLGPGTEKETPNSLSGLPASVTTVCLGDGSNPSTQVAWPDVDSPGTIHAEK